jgi:hypothetical protein
LSFKFTTTAGTTAIQIDQQSASTQAFRFLILSDHDLENGIAVLKTYPTASRTTPTVVITGTISGDPAIFDAGSDQIATFVDIDLTASGTQTSMSLGEVLVARRFGSPQLPALGISTDYVPRKTFVSMPNGERQSIQHGGVSRQKRYLIPGMDFSTAAGWIDLFNDEGDELVILQDDEGAIYPALMGQQLSVNKLAKVVSVNLEFEEVRLTR